MINKMIIDALNPLSIPVSFQIYKGSSSTYITFMEYLQQGEAFGDNHEVSTGHYIQIDLFSKSDYGNLIEEVKLLMINQGFIRQSEYDLYESDTGYFHHVFRFFYLQ